MFRPVIFLTLLFLPFVSLAQPQIAGQVMDDQQSPVPYAAVTLYNQTDSAFVQATATDDAGKFEVSVTEGTYYIRIAFLSYETRFVSDINVDKSPVNLGTISLQTNSETLEEVTVQAEKTQMELKLDKRVFNIGKDLSNQGADAAEVMDNLPSVTVDPEGNVSLRGSNNVRILIDGKPSGLSGMSNADALRQLQGDMIEKIEVITNPSARYDAEGETGIINIVLKKEKRNGVNGGFTLNGGWPENYGISANINMRKEKFNVFASYGLRYRKSPGSGDNFQRFTFEDTTFSYDRLRAHVRGGLSHNVRAGMDYNLNEHNTVTFSGMASISDGNNTVDIDYLDYDHTGALTQSVDRAEREIETRFNREFTLDHRKTFKQKDRSWTTQVKFIKSEDLESSDLLEQNSNAAIADIQQRTSNTENEENWLFQTDYVHPVGKDGKFEAGAKSTNRVLDNDYTVETLEDSGWVVFSEFDNHLVYTERIHAGYAMYGNKIKKLSYQLGLRLEHSDIKTDLKATNDVYHRTYTNLFPSTHLSYELGEHNSVQFSYSRRLSRPRFWWLLPFFGYSDPRNFFSGNPNLNPEFTNAFETGFLTQNDKGSLLTSVYYRKTDGIIERLRLNDSTGFIRSFPVNLGVEHSYGIEFSGSRELTDWWNINLNFNFYRAQRSGTYEGIDYASDTYAWTTRLNSKWKVSKKFNCQSSINYRSPRNTTQGRRLASYNWDAGASLDVLKGKGTLSFSVRDILNTRRWITVLETETMYSENDFQWRARQFLLTFNYRINQKKKRGGAPGGYSGGGGGGGM